MIDATELGSFAIKLITVALSAPFFGWGLLQLVTVIEKAWKSNSTRKKWIALSFVYFVFAILICLLR